jgi:glycolate oxidase FAD binding subunit
MREPSLFPGLPDNIRTSIRWAEHLPPGEVLSLDGKSAQGTLAVSSLKEAADFLRAASKTGMAVIPRGSGTMMGLGNPPRGADLVLDLKGLRRILEYNPENLTVTAECGLSLSELQETLGKKGQFLPLDTSFFSSATLGGIVASNANGPQRLIYGTCRDLILGMKIVLADGSFVSAGGRCVKNVSGFDLCKLFVGSLGTLGLLGELTFKVHPLPEQEAIQIGSTPDPTAALDLSHALVHSVLFPAALEILDPYLAAIWAKEMDIRLTGRDWVVLVGWAGFTEEVNRQIRETQAAFSHCKVAESEVHRGEAAPKGWEILGHLPLHLGVPAERLIRCRISLPLTLMEDGIAKWQSEAAGAGCQSALSIRAGTGVLFGHVVCPDQDPEGDKISQFLERIRLWAKGLGGTLTIETAPLWLKNRMDVWGVPGKEILLMKRLKERFDPMQTLNPGRFLGGI